MKLKFYPLNYLEDKVSFVVIISTYRNKWLYVKHKKRNTLEVPGGKLKENESPKEAAKRELFEESGALDFLLVDICDYAMIDGSKEQYGRLYFADINELGILPDFEIEERKFLEDIPINLTYKEIHHQLVNKTIEEMKKKLYQIKIF